MTATKKETEAKTPKTAKSPEKVYEKIERRMYDRLKRRAIKFEKDNRRYILVIPCDGNRGWYEMGERSALLYKYEVCDKIGVDASLKDDYDSFYIQYDIGRIRTQGVEAVRERLKRAKLYKREQTRDKCVIFELDKTYTDDEIEALHEEEKRRQEELNNIVHVKILDPVLLNKMLEVSGRLHSVCLRKMDKLSRDTNGRRIVELCDQMLGQYYLMSSSQDASPKTVLVMWQTLRDYVHRLLIELQIIVGLRIWKRTQCIKIGEMIYELEERIDAHVRKALKKVR